MTYTNSSLVSYTKLSPNHSGQRTHSIDRITPHCVVGQCSVETLGNIFLPTSRQASCNYGIGVDGRVGMYVEEKNRSWCSSSSANDQRAVTIECASDTTEPYAFKDVVYQTLIKLCVDICKRNGKKKLLWLGDKDKTLSYEPKSDEMVLTVHRWFANKSCPGSWMYARMGDLAAKVTAQLGGGASEGTETEYPEKLTEGYYRVRKAWSDSKSQKGAYKILSNAKKCADANPGYSVFDNNGVNIYTPNTSTQTAPDVPFTVKVNTDAELHAGSITTDDYSAQATLFISDVDVYGQVSYDAPEWVKAWEEYDRKVMNDEQAEMPQVITEYKLIADGKEMKPIDGGFGIDRQTGKYIVHLRYDVPESHEMLSLIPLRGADEAENPDEEIYLN